MNKVYIANLGVFLAEAREQEKKAFLSKNTPFLTEERRRKIQFYRFPDDSVRSLAAYGLLAYALKKQKGIEGPLEFVIQKEGKPYLKDHGHIFFNMSHCQNWVACIIGEDEVGIDVQDPFDYDEEMAKQFCSEQELKSIWEKKGNASRILNRLWVLKEAYTKYLGRGITPSLKEIDFSSEETLKKPGCVLYAFANKNYNLAICVRKGTEFTKEEVLLNLHNDNLYDLFTCPKYESAFV